MLSKKIATLAAVSLIVGSSASIAQAAPGPGAAAGAQSVERAGPAGEAANELYPRHGFTIYFIAAALLALVIYGVIKITDEPKSP